MKKDAAELIEELGLDPDCYDLGSINFDLADNNLDPDDPDPEQLRDYHFAQAVLNSIANGQFTQAHQQARTYGDLQGIFEYAEESEQFDEDELLTLARRLLSWSTIATA